MSYTTWRKKITANMIVNKDSWDNLIYSSLSNRELDEEFYAGYGIEEGQPFTLWTTERVYFPVCYDGAEWAGSVPRNPCEEVSRHFGGG